MNIPLRQPESLPNELHWQLLEEADADFEMNIEYH